jgi:hypothetical protein
MQTEQLEQLEETALAKLRNAAQEHDLRIQR